MIDQIYSSVFNEARLMQRNSREENSIVFRRFDAEEVRYINQIAINRFPAQVDWLDRKWSLNLLPISFPSLEKMAELLADWGNAPARIRIDSAFFDTATSLFSDSSSLEAVPDALLAVLLESALDSLLSELERFTRKRFSLIETKLLAGSRAPFETWLSQAPYGFQIQINDGETLCCAEVWLDKLGLGFLANSIRSWPTNFVPQDAWASLPINLTLTAGWTWLRLPMLRSLSTHDVVLMDECFLGGSIDRIVLILGYRRAVECRVEGAQLHIECELEGVLEDFDENNPVNFEESEPEAVMVDLPIRVQFELGEKMIPLAELQSIGPGYVINLGREIRRAVIIRANGRYIGEGELVDIDGRIGVLIHQIIAPST